jgi:hypothetical protein
MLMVFSGIVVRLRQICRNTSASLHATLVGFGNIFSFAVLNRVLPTTADACT